MRSRPRILVTGATGCIGGRLVEMLLLRDQAEVRALVRSWSRAIRLARFEVESVGGDIASADDLRRAVDGCDIVVHCAYDSGAPERNAPGAKALVEACVDAGVRRLVAVGSLAVYEPLPDGIVDESSPRQRSGWTYADTKLAVETELEEAAASTGLPLVIVEPTIVFGPFAGAWTLSPVRRLRTRRVLLPDDGEGLCYAVYVDDVVESLILAAEVEEAAGERFLVSGGAPVTWREFYGAFEEILGTRSLVFMATDEIRRRAHADGPGRVLSPASARSAVLRGGGRLAPYLGERFTRFAKARVAPPILWPDEQGLALYGTQADVKIRKAEAILGYAPRFSFEAGMQRTRDYLEWTGV